MDPILCWHIRQLNELGTCRSQVKIQFQEAKSTVCFVADFANVFIPFQVAGDVAAQIFYY